MKNIYIILLTATTFYLTSCSNSPTDKAESSVKTYMKTNLKNPDSYEPISFSKLDTLKKADTSDTKQISLYKITNIYSIVNSDKDKVKMTVSFYLDKDLKVNEANTKSINGDYGTLSGNIYWKYNNYVGNKPDAGADIVLYSLDTARGDLHFESSADVQGNYKIEKVSPGKYFLIIRSKNTTDCPESHLSNLRIYSEKIKQLFGFDIEKYKTELDELHVLDSLETISVNEFPANGTLSQMTASLDKSKQIEKDIREKSEKLIDKFPDNFKKKINLYSGYSNAFDFSTIEIEEGKNKTITTDFGITCI